MEPPRSTHLAPGQLAGGGRYELRRQLGHGGMGTVWLAFDSRLKEEVALKFLPAHIAVDATALENLRNETLRSRRLTHANIVRVHDLSESLDEIPFISMEYIQGADLNERRAQLPGKLFTWSELQPIVLQLCNALQYAHEEGVLHRDLKPGNLMLDTKDRLKLADFGIASIIQDSNRRSAPGTVITGTPAYMSPQQMQGKPPEIADDIYSLGATIYELLTGRPPFYTGDIRDQILHVSATPIEQRLWELGAENDIPPEITALILSCLAKEPELRPPSAKAFGSWTNFSPSVVVETPNVTETANIIVPKVKRSPVALFQIGVIVVALLIAAFWGGRKPAQPSASTPVASPSTNSNPTTPSVTNADTNQWQTILGGKTLLGWEGDRQFWSIRDGAITAQAPAKWKGRYMRYLVWSEGTVKNFELKFQFRTENTPNSGVMYRATPDGVGGVSGYQFEIWKEKTGNVLDVGGDKPRRDLALRGEKTHLYVNQGGSESIEMIGSLGSAGRLEAAIHPDDWNEVVIRADGTRITHIINGQPMIETNDENTKRQRLSGVLALEFYGENDQQMIQFKDMKLRRLP